MPKLLLAVMLGVSCGALISVQGACNTLLGSKIGILGSIAMVIAGNIAALSLAAPFYRAGFQMQNVGHCPWYLYFVGFLGVLILAFIILVVRQAGVASGFSLILVGQMGAALAIDHFGLFSVPPSPVSWLRTLGVLLLLAGAYCTKL